LSFCLEKSYEAVCLYALKQDFCFLILVVLVEWLDLDGAGGCGADVLAHAAAYAVFAVYIDAPVAHHECLARAGAFFDTLDAFGPLPGETSQRVE